MTLENVKRLYAHYLATGNKEAAEDLVKNNAEFRKVKLEAPKAEKETKTSK
jgi:hypothetical protein